MCFCGVITPAFAHQQGSSYSQWVLEDGVARVVSVRVSALDLTRVGIHPDSQPRSEIARYLQHNLLLEGCQAKPASVSSVAAGWYSVTWPWRCGGEGDEPHVTSTIFADVAPNHLHFVRYQNNGDEDIDVLLSRHKRSSTLVVAGTADSTGLITYIRLGVGHILRGYDHVAFLLGLVLLARRKQLLWLITGFTIGHAITLTLAATGWLLPKTMLIEAAIAWSIALLCAEVLWRRSQARWPWLLPLVLLIMAVGTLPLLMVLGFAIFTVSYAVALESAAETTRDRLTTAVTASFGLIHGCGFAAVLAGIASQSGASGISLPALFGFNLGIELGQILLVLLVLPVFWLLRRWIQPLTSALLAALLALSSYWWVLRI